MIIANINSHHPDFTCVVLTAMSNRSAPVHFLKETICSFEARIVDLAKNVKLKNVLEWPLVDLLWKARLFMFSLRLKFGATILLASSTLI